MENNEIKAWFDGARNYAEGRMLFDKYSNKAPLKKLFIRKHKPLILEYQLHKLLKVPVKKNTEVVYVEKNKKVRPIVVERIQPIEAKPVTINPQPIEPAVGRKQVVMEGKVKYEDLPDNLQALYNQNTDMYKQMRAIHEKMKLAATVEERARLRGELDNYDDAIASNWKEIDQWDGTVSEPEEKPEPTDEERDKLIMSARKFLSINLKTIKGIEGLKRQQLIFKIAERVKTITSNGAELSEKLQDEIKILGIDI